MGEIIPFPTGNGPPEIDWLEIEVIRRAKYPRLPRKALALIKRILELGPRGNPSLIRLDILHHDDYLPDPLVLMPCKGDLLWVMDLLDRVGGTLACGSVEYAVNRKKKRPPLVQVQGIGESPLEAMKLCIGPEYEHLILTQDWKVLSRDIPECDLMILLIVRRDYQDSGFLGLFDKTTALIFFERLKSGRLLETVFQLPLEECSR